MTRLKNPMELFVLLDKSNCRKCQAPTCMAFAAMVYQGRKELQECPSLSPEIIERFSDPQNSAPQNQETDREKAIQHLKRRIAAIDLQSAAHRLNAPFHQNRLTIKILGKDVSVDTRGNLYSDIHLHGWVTVPLLSYVLEGRGVSPVGEWRPLRELDGGADWYRLFAQRCEKPLKRIADTYTDLFADMLDLFAGTRAASYRDADISIMLHPLPKLPILICYWKPDEGMESDLNLFFDSTATDNLNIESIYTLGAGLVLMFEKLAQRHGLA